MNGLGDALLLVPHETGAVAKRTEVDRAGAKRHRGRQVGKSFLPRVMRDQGLMPDRSIEFPGGREPGIEGHLGEQNELAALRPDVFHQAAPISGQGFAAVVKLADGDSHVDNPIRRCAYDRQHSLFPAGV